MKRFLLSVELVSIIALGGCSSLRVEEAYLSSNQRVAVVTSRADGIAPPTTMVLLESEPGKYSTLQPVATGFGAAPLTAVMSGMGAASATALGYYHGQRVQRADSTSVTVAQGGQTQSSSSASDQSQNQDQRGGDTNVSTGETTVSTGDTNTNVSVGIP